jgi:hypothetical protein
MGIVEDHVYAGQFARTGGGGADMPVAAEPARTDVAIWGKASGDRTSYSSSVTVTPPGITFDTSSTQDAFSVLGGADIVPGGSDFRVGVFGGYTAASTSFGLPGTSSAYAGGTAGAYAAYNNGSFYADVTGKGDLLAVTYNFAGSSAPATATNLGIDANVGYRLDTGNFFVEPIGSLTAVNTRVSDISGVDFEDANSLRVGGGGRVGTTIASNGLNTEVSLLAKLWDDLSGPNTAVVSSGGSTLTATDDVGGFFGELAATVTVSNDTNGMSGFFSADGKFGANLTSYGVKTGLRVGF